MLLSLIQSILAILLIASILLQARGSGVGLAFGGDGSTYRTRRGVEKKLHIGSVVLGVAFLLVSLLNVLL